MSTLSAALGVLGLSIPEAAKFLNVPEGEVERLCTYSREVDDEIWFKLADLYHEVLLGAAVGEEQFRDLGVPEDVYEDFNSGHAGIPEGAGSAAGAMAVLNHLRMIKMSGPK